jgi:hypothetical protein
MTSLHKVEIDKKDDATFPHNFNQGYGITAQWCHFERRFALKMTGNEPMIRRHISYHSDHVALSFAKGRRVAGAQNI